MKILINEQQLKLIISEQPDSRFPVYGLTDDERRKVDYGSELEQKVTLGLMEIGATFLPIVGPFLGALQGGYYADQEYSKGNKKTGVVIGILSILPFINQIRSFIPGLKTIGQEGLINLGNKLSGVVKTPLTPIEKEIVSGLNKSIPTIEQNIDRIQDAIKNTIDYKGQYIKTYGKIKFQDLFNKLIKGDITKQQYIDELVGGLKDTYNKIKFGAVAGIKFLPQEEEAITNVAKQIQSGKVGDIFKLLLTVNGTQQEVTIILKNYPKTAFDMAAKNSKDIILVNVQNVKNFSAEKLLNTLAHEAAHIKDLSYRSTKMVNEYESILKNIDISEKLVDELTLKHGAESAEAFAAKKMFVKWFTKYQYHYMEMLANNSKVIQSLSRNIRTVVGDFGVPETQKMLAALKYGVAKGRDIDYYLHKFIGMENAKYIKQIKTFNKDLYQDLLKKLTKQINYAEEELKLYQQY